MSKKTRIKLVGEGWNKFKDSFRYSHIYQNAIIEVSFDDPLTDEFTDHHGHKWCATDVFYAIEILPDEPVQEESPAKDSADIDTLTKKIERLEKVVNEMNANLRTVKGIVSSLSGRV
jgi:hypothetical protein